MPSNRWSRVAVRNSWGSARLRRILALALCCAGVIGLLAIVGVAAQATTDYDRDDDGLIEVDSLEKLNAIRWDLDGDGDGTADDLDSNGTADYDEAFPNPATGMGCRLVDDDGNTNTPDVPVCIGYELMANLDFDTNGSRGADEGDTYWNDGAGWRPIGEYVGDPAAPFTATFDGNRDKYAISNLYIDRPTAERVGLFGEIGANAEILNVRLLKINVKALRNVGGLVGSNNGGTISASSTAGMVMGGDNQTDEINCGGLVGSNNGGTISAGSTTVAVVGIVSTTPANPQTNCGGLVGYNDGDISDSHASGSVSGLRNIGGLVGYNSGTIAASRSSGTVSGRVRLGGLVGVNQGGTISTSKASGGVSGAHVIGGLVGVNYSSISNSSATGAVNGQHYTIGGLVAWNSGTIYASYATGRVLTNDPDDPDKELGFPINVGGLVGVNAHGSIRASYAKGRVLGAYEDSGGLVGLNNGGTVLASYATGAVAGRDPSHRAGGLVGRNWDGARVIASYATGRVSAPGSVEDPNNVGQFLPNDIGGLVGANLESATTIDGNLRTAATIEDSYWDTRTSRVNVGIGNDDADDSGAIDGTETAQDGATGKTTRELQSPTDYADADPDTEDIYADWNLNVDDDLTTGDVSTGADDPWDFGTGSQYPVLKVDFDGDGDVADDVARQRPSPRPTSSPPSSSKRSSSRAPSPPPAPTRSPIIGSTPSATAKEVAGDVMVLQRHDEPGVEIPVGVGWISRDGQTIIAIGFVRDGDLGQTYAVVRREGDGQVVRRWIAPDSHLVYAVPWASVNTQYTFPVGVISAIPLDEQYPSPNMLMRRFDGGDDRILAYDAELGQWRHVPDEGTFQTLGFYWCNVTAADAGFFERITLGPPYPASGTPPRADYPVCQT